MHFRPHPRGYMRNVVPVLPLKLKNSSLYKKVNDATNDVCVIVVNKLLGNYQKDIYTGQDAIDKACSILKPFKDDYGHNRTVTRFRKSEKYCTEDIKEIFDWDYYQTSENYSWVYIAVKKREI